MIERPVRLCPWFREMVWGARSLAPWFPAPEAPVGEVWFSAKTNQTDLGVPLEELARRFGPALIGTDVPPGRFPILIKFIFPSQKLSVQVHPGDEDAARLEGTPGKVEMWHVLRAEPGAAIALGFERPITRERLAESARSGEIERLLRWFPVQPGDTFFTPPGTVHAIGPGVVVCEVQQHSDLTYRLYDYGRGRELHLDKGVQVANLNPHPGPSRPSPVAGGGEMLAFCPYFAVESSALSGPLSYRPDPERCHFLVILEGSGAIGASRFAAGEVWLVPAAAAPFLLDPGEPVRLLKTYVPGPA